MSESSSMLFDVSPVEDEKPKRKGGKRKSTQDAVTTAAAVYEEPKPVYGFLASIVGHYQCDKCGLETLDLVDTRIVDSEKWWLVTCGWWCMHSWLVRPIPGLLDEEDKRQTQEFRVRGGLFDGQTFGEIAASGKRWYVEFLSKEKSRPTAAAAAAEWLAKNS